MAQGLRNEDQFGGSASSVKKLVSNKAGDAGSQTGQASRACV